ncbi:hypothetical protein [Caballeronia sp. Lep1P3]|uniref:hypothetical protein n=1 Tax=Caballeronia sp. Lep1P3 TaxID=2878150 RepID=UPI00025BCD18|nr:hypothetical protein [Caballeronia sp. Lep1P3]EKS72752.1 hypothetical protein BURK_004847 [Burkholderia sp. SJ98]
MRRIVKLVLSFLIAWLPLSGFAAPALLCPHHASPVVTSQLASHQGTTPMVDMHAAAAGAAQHHQPTCQSCAGALSCVMFALPAATSVPVPAIASTTYAHHNTLLISQFIPELPQRPPQAL